MFKDYYKILGITSDASSEEIKKAYRTQSMRWHPDRNPGADTTAMMQDINEAYNILKDPSTRERYDREYRQYNSTFYSQTETPKNKNDYDIQDETLKEDIRVARKSAEDYVREFYASLKKDTRKAAHGAWEEIKGYVIVGVVMSLLVLIIGMCNADNNNVPINKNNYGIPTSQNTTTNNYYFPKYPSANPIPPMENKNPDHWRTFTSQNAFTIQVPVTVEKQTKDSKYIKQLAEKGFQRQDDFDIFNQKGLGDMTPEAMNQYCRIILAYYEENDGDYLSKDETEPFDSEFDQSLKDMVIGEIGFNSKLIGSFTREWVRINNANAILVSYRRTGNNFDYTIPVNCRILIFQNNNKCAKMILSYREKESELWADDFEQVLRSFKWK